MAENSVNSFLDQILHLNERILIWTPYATVTLLFLVLWLGFDFNGLYGQDAHEYYRYSNALKDFMETGTDPGSFVWPKLYPMLGTVIGFTGIPIGFALQLVSLFAMLGALLYTQRCIRLLYNSSGSWFLLLAAVTQVYFVRAGMVVMSDALAAFFVMGFVFYYLRLRKEPRIKKFVWILLFAIAGSFTRYAVVPLIVIPLLHSVWIISKRWHLSLRVAAGLILVTSGFLLLLLNNQALDLVNSIAGQWNPICLFQREFLFQSHIESYWVPNGLYMWSNFAHIGYLSCGVLLFFWWRQWNFRLKFLWIGVLVYLVFIGGIGFQNQRFMVISHLPILVLIFPSFESLEIWLTRRKIWWVFIAGVLAFNSAFFYYSFSKMFAMHRFEKVVAEATHKLDDDSTIYAFYVTPSLGSYDIPNKRVDLWEQEIEFEKGGYVIFNPELFADNIRVMKNWNELNRDFELEIIDELPENWNIYRIQ